MTTSEICSFWLKNELDYVFSNLFQILEFIIFIFIQPNTHFIILIRFLQIEKFTAVNIHEMRCKAKMTLFSSKFAASLNFAQALLGLIAIPDNID